MSASNWCKRSSGKTHRRSVIGVRLPWRAIALARLAQRAPLRPVGVEILRFEPAFASGFARGPFAGQHREPGGVAIAALDDHVIAENPLERKTEPDGGAARGGIEGIAFPFVAAIAERIEGVTGQEILRLGGERRALHLRTEQEN